MKDVVILGAGGHAHVVADIIEAEGNNVVAFLDDDLSQSDCCGPISDYINYDCEFVIGIGNPDIRERLSNLNLKWHTAVHPKAVVSPSADIGEGTVVMPNAIVNARSKIGKHCIINSGAIVEHDNLIYDYVHISVGSNLGGTVTVGRKTWVGIGAVVKNNVRVCDNVIIGAGAVVVKDIAVPGKYIGVPVKRI